MNLKRSRAKKTTNGWPIQSFEAHEYNMAIYSTRPWPGRTVLPHAKRSSASHQYIRDPTTTLGKMKEGREEDHVQQSTKRGTTRKENLHLVLLEACIFFANLTIKEKTWGLLKSQANPRKPEKPKENGP